MIDVDAQLTTRYEELRSHALAGGHGLGLTLVLRRGMIAWLETCSMCARPSLSLRPGPSAPHGLHLPPELHAEVARLLAGMALGFCQEVAS